ncbi:MAG: hypothetical protein KA369_14035 [Spirochaetes bacterium]|nr:hypothetical protein [Spirochaetota bacterium]
MRISPAKLKMILMGLQMAIVIAPAIAADMRQRLDEEVRRSLPAGQETACVSQGDFGPTVGGAIVIYREEECSECRYSGLALVPQKGGPRRVVQLPDIRQFDNLTVDNRGAGPILFADVDSDGQKEVLILVSGYRKGPEGYPLTVVAVMDWNGTSFAALTKVENYFSDQCSNATQVRAMINTLVTCAGSYMSETAGVSADLAVSLGENGELKGTWNSVYGQAHLCDRLTFNLRQGRGRIELVKGGASGADEVIGAMQVTGKKAVIRFLKDLGEFDCGAGHPPVVKLRRK